MSKKIEGRAEIVVRLPIELHAWIKERAKKAALPVNSVIVTALMEWMEKSK